MAITIEVDPYPEPCATTGGKSLKRASGPDGKPQSVPFYPCDQRSRRIDFGMMDMSALPIESSSFDDLDPIEFERVRQTISRLKSDPALQGLADADLAKALRLVESRGGRLVPNLAGLLILGREDRLRALIPTHQVSFQALDVEGNVKVNDVFYGPVVRALNELEERFSTRNEEREILVGFVRVPVPDYSPEGFREAVNNALLHRDYNLPDAVYI